MTLVIKTLDLHKSYRPDDTNLQNSALTHIGNVVVVKAHGFWGDTQNSRMQNVDIRKCNLGEKVS